MLGYRASMRSSLLSLTVAVALVTAGCGGDDKAANQPKPPTKAEYIAKVDPICAQANAESEDAGRDLGRALQSSRNPDKALGKAATVLKRTEEQTQRRIEEIKRVPLPAGGDRQGAQRFLTALDENLDLLKDLRAAAEAGDVRSFQTAASELQSEGDKATGVAQAYGFRDCGEEDS